MSGRAWAYAAAALGAVVSVAANVGHSYVPPAGSPSSWHPHAGAVGLAAFWPCAVVLAVEVLARVPWPPERRWSVLRWGGLAPVAAVAAVVSYRHLSGLLGWYGEDGVTVALGPLAVDGLMTVATGALLATAGQAGRTLAERPPVAAVEAQDEGPAQSAPLPPGEGQDEAHSAAGASEPAAVRKPAEMPAKPKRSRPQPSPDVDDLLLVGQAVAADLEHRGQPLTRRSLVEGLRGRGHAVSTGRAGELLKALRAA